MLNEIILKCTNVLIKNIMHYLPFCTTIFKNTLARMLWHFTFSIAHAMIKHTTCTFHARYMFSTIFETVRCKFARTSSIKFFGEKFLTISVNWTFFFLILFNFEWFFLMTINFTCIASVVWMDLSLSKYLNIVF